MVVVSLVRSNREHKAGFLNTSNRINVLLSRAMHGMVLVGNRQTFEAAKTTPMRVTPHSINGCSKLPACDMILDTLIRKFGKGSIEPMFSWHLASALAAEKLKSVSWQASVVSVLVFSELEDSTTITCHNATLSISPACRLLQCADSTALPPSLCNQKHHNHHSPSKKAVL